MEMKCEVETGTTIREWTVQRHATTEEEKIWVNWNEHPIKNDEKFPHIGSRITENGPVLIYSNASLLEDAGVYTCYFQKGGSQTFKYSFHLIVVGKD